MLIFVGILLVLHFLRADTRINPAPAAITTRVSYDTTKYQTLTTPFFSISLPSDWRAVSRSSDVPAPAYNWQGTNSTNADRWLSVYVDENVSDLAINRALDVQGDQTHLTVLGDVSDNCLTFTGAAAQNQGHSTPAKWQDIDFLCDSGNYERDVVGIVSSDGLNNVTLSGAGDSHRFFFTYTDNTPTPDYTIFTKALKSIRTK